MIGTYASAALICAASLLVGRALLTVAGRRRWSWLEPAVGFAAILTVTGVLARAPGHGTSATLGAVALVLVAALIAWRTRYEAPRALRTGLPVAIALALALALPFAISGRWGLLGIGFNNDLGLHLAWAEWLRSGLGPTPDVGYPLGPHGLAVAVAAFPGLGLGEAFLGEIVAIGVLTALTALGAMAGLDGWRRWLAATMVAIPYLAASYYAQAAFKETAEALFVLAFAIGLAQLSRRREESGTLWPEMANPVERRWAIAAATLPALALFGGIFFSYSFAGVAWPVAIIAAWSLTVPAVRRALRPRALLRFGLRPASLLAIVVVVGLGVVLTVVGPFGFASGFGKVAGSNTYGPVSPLESLGVWFTSNYRIDGAGGARLPVLAATIAILALAAGVAWWLQRRQPTIPLALGTCAALYLASLPFSGDYSQAKALMIAAPLAMLVAVKPLLAEFLRASQAQLRIAWSLLAVAFVGGALYSSFLVLRDAPVAPGGHGAELAAFLPIIRGEPVLYAGQDRYAAYELLGADTHVPLVEFPDEGLDPNPEKPFDTGNAYGPIDFDSFSRGTLSRFPYVVTSRAAWNSKPPANFERVAETPSYVLWKRTGGTPDNRHVLLEGVESGAFANCDSPEVRILFESGGRASLFPGAAIGSKDEWDPASVLQAGTEASLTLDLPRGAWNLSLQYFAPFGLTLSAPGFSTALPAALDGQRPNTISLANNGQYWPAGRFQSEGGEVTFTLAAAEPSTLQRLAGWDAKAFVGELVAVPAEPHRSVDLADACDSWIDWFISEESP
ncbi:MAG: hypothetical protein R2725_05560 [Solirubrobacterales bacterium]